MHKAFSAIGETTLFRFFTSANSWWRSRAGLSRIGISCQHRGQNQYMWWWRIWRSKQAEQQGQAFIEFLQFDAYDDTTH